MQKFADLFESPIGEIMLTTDGEALTGCFINGQQHFEEAKAHNLPGNNHPVLNLAKDWLKAYFAGKKPPINDLPISLKGSEFRQMVWKLLQEIPYGHCLTYGDLAQKIVSIKGAGRMSAQAVGGAVGHNPVSIIIPCHRVIGRGGKLIGYGGGIKLKIWLLRHEGLDL